jgi:hypothetical protein
MNTTWLEEACNLDHSLLISTLLQAASGYQHPAQIYKSKNRFTNSLIVVASSGLCWVNRPSWYKQPRQSTVAALNRQRRLIHFWRSF